jgi:hypothetical protein
MEQFPKFWFESNLFFGWICCLNDLQKMFDIYKEYRNKDEILDESREYTGVFHKDHFEFGFGFEYKGKTLKQFLNGYGYEKNINLINYNN